MTPRADVAAPRRRHAHQDGRASPVAVIVVSLLAVAVLALRLATGCGEATDEAEEGFVDPTAFTGVTMDEETARAFFPPLRQPGGKKLYDPLAWVVLAPGFEGEREWPEAPEGKIEIHTNNMGFREDQPTLLEKHGLRILVVGDSHTEGAVSAKYSYANVLERLLSEQRGEPVEVINAGVGGTGPHNFLGMIRKQLVLKPDMVIAACYSGNDPMNALTVSDFFTKRPSRPRTAEYRDPLQAANERWPDLLAQGFNQADYFAWAPGDADVAEEVTIDVFEQMADLCDQNGIRFAAVILPSKPDVDTDDDRIDAILGDLDLTREQFAVNLQIARNLAAALRERGIVCVDPTDAMRASDTPFYWKKDHHLDIAGHALVARLLQRALF